MPVRIVLSASLLSLLLLGAVSAQKPFREWPAIEYEGFALPKDANQPAEWTRARLRYSDETGYPNRSRFRMNDGSAFPGYWTMDYPRSDRHLLAGVRRLTRIDSKSVEQVVTLDGSDDIYNFPVMYGVEVGHWALSDEEVKQFRDYLLRGGFFMCDDFHGDAEWDQFTRSMNRVFPDRQIVDLKDDDAIFHVLYDLDDKFQVPGAQYFDTGLTLREGSLRKDAALARNLRRQGPADGRDLPQHGFGRCLGTFRRAALYGKMGFARIQDRDELFHLRPDALDPVQRLCRWAMSPP